MRSSIPFLAATKAAALAALVGLELASLLPAQSAGSALNVHNAFRVLSSTTHPVTGRRYPYPPTQPQSYATQPGVPKGYRVWTHAPQVRAQGGSQGASYLTVRGFTQSVHIGAAVTANPSLTHYQFRTGVAPAAAATPPMFSHALTGQDLIHVADQPLPGLDPTINDGIYRHTFSLATPIALPPVELVLFLELRGGEWQDDPIGQTYGVDWRGNVGPGGLAYAGWVDASTPRLPTAYTGQIYRPCVGLLVAEPVLTITGDHANNYYLPRDPRESYAGLSAHMAPWASDPRANVFFHLTAGGSHKPGDNAIVLLNVSRTFWSQRLQVGSLGWLLLDPFDPALSLLTAMLLPLNANANYNGQGTPLKLNPLGQSAIGVYVKAQGLVFDAGFTNAKLTTASSCYIYQ